MGYGAVDKVVERGVGLAVAQESRKEVADEEHDRGGDRVFKHH